jgi:L-iditol 2-dehydrogenase
VKIYHLYGAMDLRLEEADTPVPGFGEVQIRTAYVGICGSDMPRIIRGEGIPFFPATLGHEFSAVVTEVGAGVTRLLPGDHVVVAPRLACGRCIHCRNGNAGQCTDGKFLGLSVPNIGGFAEYNVLPEKNLVKLPMEMALTHAAMVEPITVGLHALSLMKFDPEKPVAVIGAGTIGMLLIQSIHALGAKTIYVFDVDDSKLRQAAAFGASRCYNTRSEGFVARFMEDTDNYGAPQVLEAVGIQKTILLALEIASVMADVALIGDVLEPITIPAFDFKRRFAYHQLHLHGVYQSYTDGFPGKEFGRAIDLINRGRIDLQPMIHAVDRLSRLLSYMELAQTPGAIHGKLIFYFDTPENSEKPSVQTGLSNSNQNTAKLQK